MPKMLVQERLKRNREKLKDLRMVLTYLKNLCAVKRTKFDVVMNRVLAKRGYLERLAQMIISNYYELFLLRDEVVSLSRSELLSRALKKEWRRELDKLSDEFEELVSSRELLKTIKVSNAIIDMVKNA